MVENLRDPDTHFAFGSNWASYSHLIGPAEVDEATASLTRLLGTPNLTGKTFLDIGCGSGLHSVAALRLGASRVLAVDIDAESVRTAGEVLAKLCPGGSYRVEQSSVFDLLPERHGRFDIVYSWGVLHHTGDMVNAIRTAARVVDRPGTFAFALYRRTYLDRLWVIEKRWYSSASRRSQRVAQGLFIGAHRTLLAIAQVVGLRRRQAASAKSGRGRGMDFRHDVHDWLGGYPYESILPEEVGTLMSGLGFQQEAAFLRHDSTRKSHGVFGASCDEYRYSIAACGQAST